MQKLTLKSVKSKARAAFKARNRGAVNPDDHAQEAQKDSPHWPEVPRPDDGEDRHREGPHHRPHRGPDDRILDDVAMLRGQRFHAPAQCPGDRRRRGSLSSVIAASRSGQDTFMLD